MKKVKTVYGYGIYQLTKKEIAKANKEGMYPSEYQVFLPGDSPADLSYPEFECESVQECIDNITHTTTPSRATYPEEKEHNMTQYFIVTADDYDGKEIPENEYTKIWEESKTANNSYTVYDAEAKIVMRDDDDDEEEYTLVAYKENGLWVSVPEAFKSTNVIFHIE